MVLSSSPKRPASPAWGLRPATAIRGDGVVETLYAVLQRCYRSLDRQFGLAEKWQIPEKEFLGHIFSHVDLRGTRLPPEVAAP